MKKLKKTNKIYIGLIALITFVLSGCSLQTDYDYKGQTLDPHVNKTAWEYFQSRPDVFSVFTEAITYAGMEDYYKQTDVKYTFLALNNTAMNLFITNTNPAAVSVTQLDQTVVKQMLQYHIVKGEYSAYKQLPVEPMFVLTLLPGEPGLMTLLVRKSPWQDDAGKIFVNDTGSNGTSPSRSAVTSNILPTNGVIHVFANYCYYKP
ncbi:fasciclin domain-containing protein [Pseudopedobacter beijingensis]|uniref:Fasciclin domain-containing protein n=1 Tax=Pseudopedobacter beijingensis TaxID=1207056 RepID=A0ABW4ICY8_9SPHI